MIAIDPVARTAEVEGMTTYADLVDATLPLGLAPAVVPELKSITVGGATTGLGIESSSFRFGLVHETIDEFDVLVADGQVLRCSPTEHADLFCGFPNSYGSLGYATRLTVRLVPIEPFVRLSHERFADAGLYFTAIAKECANATCDYLDGVFFGPGDFVLTRATLIDRIPVGAAASDYTWMRQYWRSLRSRADDYLDDQGLSLAMGYRLVLVQPERGRAVHAGTPALGPRLLSSVIYQKIMRAGQRYPLKALEHCGHARSR